jgi:type IV pilus assembly protein PilW
MALKGNKDIGPKNFFKMACISFRGVTLIELLIAMVVGLIAVSAVYSVYTTHQHSYRNQQLTLETRQNLRCATIILEQEIRMAGFDPRETGHFGIVDIRRYDILKSNLPDPEGQPALFYTVDINADGDLDRRNANRNREHPNFKIRYDQNIQRSYLAWDMGSGRQPLAEGIQAIGFAYAVDADDDGVADRWKDGPHLIWAVDSDNDNMLDTNIDTNDDGVITTGDDRDGDNKITMADGGLLVPPVSVDRIKAVRFWLLSVSVHPVRGHYDTTDYLVGDRIFPAFTDSYKRNVLESVVECRNL